MSKFSRREFLKISSGICGVFPFVLKSFGNGAETGNFEMLVIGDSLMFGQGLEEKDKFYTLVKNWLQTVQEKPVRVNVKAHTAATVFLHRDDSIFLQNSTETDYKNFPPEIGLPFPTLKTQIELAENEYRDPEAVDLIMISGGLVDLTVAGILNPYGSDENLKNKIKKHCFNDMSKFLLDAARIFPRAKIIVVGYYPIITAQTDTGKMFNAFLESYGFPRPLKPLVNNLIGKQFFKRVRRRAIKRSKIWVETSNEQFEKTVNVVNSVFNQARAIFVKSPIGEKNAFETKETLLFKVNKKGVTDDFLFTERAAKCRKILLELKEKIGFEDSVRQCQISSIGHPNIAGAKLYSDAIIEKLKNKFTM